MYQPIREQYSNNRNYINQSDRVNNRVNQDRERRPWNADNEYHQHKKTVPGNSTYTDIAKNGRKVILLSDSMCGRMNMKDFSNKIKNGIGYRTYYPKATAVNLKHYCTEPLNHDKTDEVIIHVGTNSLGKEDTCKIAKDITEVVKTVREHGVNKIYVSAITFRPGFENEVKQVNDILYQKSHIYDYKFIGNTNITSSFIFKDKTHLTDDGTKMLSANFIRAVNSNIKFPV